MNHYEENMNKIINKIFRNKTYIFVYALNFF